MKSHDKLIQELSTDLAPVVRAPDVNRLGLMWLLLAGGFVVAVIHLTGPIRPGAFDQLASKPRFLVETLLGLVAIVFAGLMAFRGSIPAGLGKRFATVSLVLMALWIVQYVVGLFSPALEPSMLGKREHCYLESILYSAAPLVAALILVRRFYPLNYKLTAMSLGLAAGMMPALYMQLACMYEPVHILSLHILPGLAMVLIAGGIAALWPLRHKAPARD